MDTPINREPTPTERFYRELLSEEDQRLFDAAPADPDLSGDIRLLRTLIGRLAMEGSMVKEEVKIRQAIGILYRLIQVQTRSLDGESDFELGLRELAERVLDGEDGDPG